jgi:hypothetical protein
MGKYGNYKNGICCYCLLHVSILPVVYPGIFSGGGLHQEFFFEGDSTNSVKDRGQREWESGGGSPLVKCIFHGTGNSDVLSVRH